MKNDPYNRQAKGYYHHATPILRTDAVSIPINLKNNVLCIFNKKALVESLKSLGT